MSLEKIIYRILKGKGAWSKTSFTEAGTFIAPKKGLYFVRATAGGGGGHPSGGGGASGAACDMAPVSLEKGESVSIVIGAGGAVGGIGGTTSFGSYISLPGGSPGPSNTASEVSSGGLRSFRTGSTLVGGVSPDTITIGCYISGASVFVLGSGVYLYGNSRYPAAAGHAAGYFGTRGNNSGAGGDPNSAGYSGYIEVLWQEA